ncbi:MAG: M56 family metallopeptidase [Acidobacteriota bacterium]
MSPWLESVVLSWWSSIAPLAVQAAVLVPLVALVDRLLPRRTWPQLRAAMWLFVLVRLLLPPAWLVVPGEETWLPVAQLPGTSFSGATLADTVLDAEREPVVLWAGLAVGVWLLGLVLLVASGVTWHVRAVSRWRRQSHDASPEWFQELVETCAGRLGLRRSPEVRFGQAMGSPFVAGFWRPTIYLPEELLDDTPREHLEHVMLHELAHVRRRDTWIAAGCAAVTALYWFHPCIWWAQHRLRALREQCCDRTVTRVLGDGRDYRRTLLFFAAKRFGEPLGGLAFLQPQSLLILRLKLLEDTFERPWLRRATTLVVLTVLLLLSLPAAHAADRTVEAVGEVIERPPGCLELRYLVLQRLAQERAAASASASQTND